MQRYTPTRPSQVRRRELQAIADRIAIATATAAIVALALIINALVETEFYQQLIIALS